MGDPQPLDDTEQLEILTLLEAASTEPSAMRAARALAELMRHLNTLGQRIAAELPGYELQHASPPIATLLQQTQAEVPAGWWRSPAATCQAPPGGPRGRFLTAGRVLRLPLGVAVAPRRAGAGGPDPVDPRSARSARHAQVRVEAPAELQACLRACLAVTSFRTGSRPTLRAAASGGRPRLGNQ